MKTCKKCLKSLPLTEYYNHPNTRDGKLNYCKACKLAQNKAWSDAHPEQHRALQDRWNAENEERIREQWLWREYRVTGEWYDAKYEEQGGRCAICGCTKNGRRKYFCVDHDHKTGQVRGLLCNPCNARHVAAAEHPLRPRTDSYINHYKNKVGQDSEAVVQLKL